jgi:hypothetical protein
MILAKKVADIRPPLAPPSAAPSRPPQHHKDKKKPIDCIGRESNPGLADIEIDGNG